MRIKSTRAPTGTLVSGLPKFDAYVLYGWSLNNSLTPLVKVVAMIYGIFVILTDLSLVCKLQTVKLFLFYNGLSQGASV